MQPRQGFRQAFVVACQPTKSCSPRKAALHYPASGQQHEPSLGIGQLDHLQLDAFPFGRFRHSLANLIGRAVEGGLDLYIEACTEEPQDNYKPLAQLAGSSGYSADYLGWLFRQGRLEAVKRGGRLYSTEEAVERYKEGVKDEIAPKGRPRKEQL